MQYKLRDYFRILWEVLVGLSILVIVAVLVIELFFNPSSGQLEMLHIIDIVALSFLFMELLYGFYKAKDKKAFVMREWLLIISFLPLGVVLRAGGFIGGSRLFAYVAGLFSRLKGLFRLERVGLETAQTGVHSSKIFAFLGKAERIVTELLRMIRPVAAIFYKKRKHEAGKKKRKK